MGRVLNATGPTARVYHRCSWCGVSIRPGDRYSRTVVVSDGDLYTWKAHEVCDHVAQHLMSELHLDEMTDYAWWEYVMDGGADALHEAIGRAYPWHHPQVMRLRQMLTEARLPRRLSAYPSNTRRRLRWSPCWRGELTCWRRTP